MPPPRFTVRTDAAALILVDMQEMLCRPDKGLGIALSAAPAFSDYFFQRLETVIPAQQCLLEFFRAAQKKIVFLTIGPNARDGSDLAAWRRRRNAEMLATRAAN